MRRIYSYAARIPSTRASASYVACGLGRMHNGRRRLAVVAQPVEEDRASVRLLVEGRARELEACGFGRVLQLHESFFSPSSSTGPPATKHRTRWG